ncbi:MAG: hypothetical protein LUD80_03840 [Clostridiales bacterium]|nr:hypothetical protein [Clostridiales bacterium]
MADIRWTMVDAREQVRQALESMETERSFSLRGRFAPGSAEPPVVVWGEYSNIATDCPVVDELVFQVDLWTADRDSQNELAAAVNQALGEIGLRRIYAGPDGYEDIGPGYCRKTLRFGRRVDKRTLRLVD